MGTHSLLDTSISETTDSKPERFDLGRMDQSLMLQSYSTSYPYIVDPPSPRRWTFMLAADTSMDQGGPESSDHGVLPRAR